MITNINEFKKINVQNVSKEPFNNTNESRQTTDLEKNVMLFLNDLRDSGVTNMYVASPYIVDEFDITPNEAHKILALWMKNFNDEGNYDEINESMENITLARIKNNIEILKENGYSIDQIKLNLDKILDKIFELEHKTL